MHKFHNISTEETLSRLGSTKQGLSITEVATRQEQYGKNALVEGKRKSAIIVFLEQFKDLLVIILMIAAIVSAITGELTSTIVIIVVIFLNAVLGTVQHLKAEKSLEALKALSSPNAKVIRDGQTVLVPSAEVVVGDIIILEAGDLVVADGRLLDNYSLQVNESSLTGESTAVEKSTATIEGDEIALGDRINMVFSGSLVTYGRAVMIVTAIGMETELGKIAKLMIDTKDKKTPLQKNLDQFSKVLAIVIIGICFVVFGLTLWRGWAPENIFGSFTNALLFAVALAVAAIPEALSSIVTIVQAVGTQKMAKQNAIIKDLKAVESLGAVSIICSDKTGTLTQNKMTAQEVYVGEKRISSSGLDKSSPLHNALLHAMVTVNDSTNQGGKEIGDPTEIALINFAKKYDIDEVTYRNNNPRLAELAFDSDRKLMSIVTAQGDKSVMYTKGAIDVLLLRATSIMTDNGVRAFTQEDKKNIEEANLYFSQNGLRVLAFAYKEHSGNITLDDEQGYTIIGLVSMIDPPREESMQAVADAKLAGIKPIMITGDHKITASAIAKQIGIMEDGDDALEGVELAAMTEEELDSRLANISVYARVSPEHKIRIVDAWQRRGNIVAMTGDGVNDAPALKKADIGVAMGITGTEVSKDAADMILADDNFATIVKSVANGRNVYNNIRNAVVFLLSGNIAGIFCILITSLIGLPQPFTTIHLLFINLLTDSLPAIAIGMEPARHDLLLNKPRSPKEPLLTRGLLSMIGVQGLIICAFTMGAYALPGTADPMVCATMAFATMTLARLFHGFNSRGRSNIFKIGFSTNWYSLGAFCAGALLLVAVIFIPGVNGVFDVAKLPAAYYGYIVLFAIAPTVIIQSIKAVIDAYEHFSKKRVRFSF